MNRQQDSTLNRIEALREYLKTYYIFRGFDRHKADEILQTINEIRLSLATEAELRQIYWEQINIRQTAAAYQDNYFFTRGDTDFTVVGGIANLTSTVLISLLHQGARQNVLTRENVQWQALFSDIQQAAPVGQQFPFDFEQELLFESNQSLQIGITGETTAGKRLFLRGCNLKNDHPPNLHDLTKEIEDSLPQWQIVPLTFLFPIGSADAIDVSGNSDIYSIKSDRSVLLTHVSTSAVNFFASLFDDGRSQQMCNRVDIRGIAGAFNNVYATYYPLPYPHLLRKQDRLKLRASLQAGVSASESLQYINFSGFTI